MFILKLYFCGEIRRIAVEQAKDITINALRYRFENIYLDRTRNSTGKAPRIRVTFKDDDDEEVTLGTDEELQEAMAIAGQQGRTSLRLVGHVKGGDNDRATTTTTSPMPDTTSATPATTSPAPAARGPAPEPTETPVSATAENPQASVPASPSAAPHSPPPVGPQVGMKLLAEMLPALLGGASVVGMTGLQDAVNRASAAPAAAPPAPAPAPAAAEATPPPSSGPGGAPEAEAAAAAAAAMSAEAAAAAATAVSAALPAVLQVVRQTTCGAQWLHELVPAVLVAAGAVPPGGPVSSAPLPPPPEQQPQPREAPPAAAPAGAADGDPGQQQQQQQQQEQEEPEEGKEGSTAAAAEEEVVHRGVTCDGCGAHPILGVRYKCAVRDDYDLCGTCEARDASPYPFLKIRTPDQSPAAIVCVLHPRQPGPDADGGAPPAQQQQQQQQQQQSMSGQQQQQQGQPQHGGTWGPGGIWRGPGCFGPGGGGGGGMGYRQRTWGEGRREGRRWRRHMARRQAEAMAAQAATAAAATAAAGGGGGGEDGPRPWRGPRLQQRMDEEAQLSEPEQLEMQAAIAQSLQEPSSTQQTDTTAPPSPSPGLSAPVPATAPPPPPPATAPARAGSPTAAGPPRGDMALDQMMEASAKALGSSMSGATVSTSVSSSGGGDRAASARLQGSEASDEMLAASIRTLASSMSSSLGAHQAQMPSQEQQQQQQQPPQPPQPLSVQPRLMARFVTDVTAADGAPLPPNTRFTKTWRMRNDGSVPLPPGCRLVPVGGDLMSGPEEGVPVAPDGVVPSENFDLSVLLTTPALPGRYVGYWRLRNPSGQSFGHRLWADVFVTGGTADLLGAGNAVSVAADGDWDVVNISRLATAVQNAASNTSNTAAATDAAASAADPGAAAPASAAAASTAAAATAGPPEGVEETKSSASSAGTAATGNDLQNLQVPRGAPAAEAPVPPAAAERPPHEQRQLQEKQEVGVSSSSVGASVAVGAPAPAAMTTAKWHRELCSLAEMGFLDTERNVELLERHLEGPGQSGMERVLHDLLLWHEKRF